MCALVQTRTSRSFKECPLSYDADRRTKRGDDKQARENDSIQAKPQERLIQSSAEFIATFECPDPLIEGIIMRKFFYAITGHVSKGKTAAALLFAARIGLGKMLGSLEVEQGRVLYLAGENYVDIQMRWIAMAQQMDFDVTTIPVYFRRGRFKLSGKMDQLRREVDQFGGVDLVIVDGSTAFFEGDDENSNAQAGTHAVRRRELTTLKGARSHATRRTGHSKKSATIPIAPKPISQDN